MTDRPDDRARRLSAALRANLRKRKAQAKMRGDDGEEGAPPAGDGVNRVPSAKEDGDGEDR